MIVIVDERAEVSAAYRSSLGREGMSAAGFTPGEFDGWFLATSGPDLTAIEAFILGDFDGRETLTRAIRAKSAAPAIALNDGFGLDRTLRLYAAGMDDVVRKPVHAREIIARIAAIRRRAIAAAPGFAAGGLTVHGDGRDPEADGRIIALPRHERRILEYLAANRLRRVSRAQIFNAVYGLFDDTVDESVVESHISKLRKKLRSNLGYDPIDTRRYLGYRLVMPAAGG